MIIAKKKSRNGRSNKPESRGGRRHQCLKTVKIAIFDFIMKNELSNKSLQEWMESQEESTKLFSILIF